MTRILLVEDDVKLSHLIRDFLETIPEYEVAVESRGDTAVPRIVSEKPDLVILDIMLPGLDGLSVCKEVRDQYKGPILMLTALGDEVDEVVGLEIGADDYLAKPASPRLLLARIKTLLRRSSSGTHDDETGDVTASVLVLGDLMVDLGARTVEVAQQSVDLTTAEFDLLVLLARHAGQVLTREGIYKTLRGIEWDGMDRSIDLRIARLRKKLGDDAKTPMRIKSVRGTGYLLAVIQ